jgi:hypothetical protein
MSAPPVYPSAPVWPPAGYNPYTLDATQILSAMQNNSLTENIYDSTNKMVGSVNDAQRLLTQEHAGVNKNIYDSNNQLFGELNATQRLLATEIAGVNKNIYDTIAQNGIAIERTSANGMATSERVAAQLASAIERNGNNNSSVTERVNSQLASAIERNGANTIATTERNGGNITTTIERVAGEGRLTTTVTDAASRQAANDSARDILRAVDRVGSEAVVTTKDAYNGLLASIERNSGENRMATVLADTASQARLADTRRDINTSITNLEGELLLTLNKISGDTIQSIGNTAWETRQNNNAHFATLLSETQKSSAANALQSAQNYASTLLENQKSFNLLGKQHDNQFAAMISKQDNNFATLLLEQQKTKECLAQQAAQQFAISQLEAQKVKEVITLQLQDAKYEALKSKNELSKEMSECCCDIKQKIDQRTQDVIGTVDTLDRNRLRDEINTTNNENNLLKFAEFGPWGYDYGRRGRGSRRNHGRR